MLAGHFIEVDGERLFCAVHKPGELDAVPGTAGAPAVLVVPAFWDEMNSSRRMLAECGRRLNRDGLTLFVPDLSGTGDSTGTLTDATWSRWIAQLAAIARWMDDAGYSLAGLIAVRAGALLAASAVATPDAGLDPKRTALWQPLARGQSAVRQMMRVRTAASALRADVKENVTELTDQVLSGGTVLTAGYAMHPGVVEPLNRAVLADLVSPALGAVRVFEIAGALTEPEHSDESLGAIQTTRSRLPGQPFWNPGNVIVNTDLIDATSHYFAA